jgi:hypothetical protein
MTGRRICFSFVGLISITNLPPFAIGAHAASQQLDDSQIKRWNQGWNLEKSWEFRSLSSFSGAYSVERNQFQAGADRKIGESGCKLTVWAMLGAVHDHWRCWA